MLCDDVVSLSAHTFGLFSPDEDPTRGHWLESGRTLKSYNLRSGVREGRERGCRVCVCVCVCWEGCTVYKAHMSMNMNTHVHTLSMPPPPPQHTPCVHAHTHTTHSCVHILHFPSSLSLPPSRVWWSTALSREPYEYRHWMEP